MKSRMKLAVVAVTIAAALVDWIGKPAPTATLKPALAALVSSTETLD